eukprot:261505_1
MALCFCLFEVKSLRWILKFIWNVLELITTKFNFPIDIISILSLELNGRIHGGPNVKDVLYSNDEALYDNINDIMMDIKSRYYEGSWSKTDKTHKMIQKWNHIIHQININNSRWRKQIHFERNKCNDINNGITNDNDNIIADADSDNDNLTPIYIFIITYILIVIQNKDNINKNIFLYELNLTPIYMCIHLETTKSIYKHKSVENNIECTALEGGNYVECNENCNFANPNCYYGNGAASPGQICYCYTDKDLATIKPTMKPSESEVNDIECTPLQGGDYTSCNTYCYKGNSDCYYGTGAAFPGQHCYCYTDSSKHETVKSIYKHKSVENNIECTALEGGNYVECNENCNFANPNCYYGNGAAH